MSRFLLTGCAGFIGSHLADSLLAAGDEVIGLDAFTDYYPRRFKERNLAEALAHPAFTLEDADLSAATAQDRLLEGVEGIFHFAAQPGVRSSWGDSFARYARDNVVASQRLFEAAAAARIRVVWASSSSVYGNARAFPISEDTQPEPISPYGITKLACEHLARAYRENFGLDHVGLRFFTVYGPRQRPDMAFRRIAQALLDDAKFTIFGTGRQSRDFTYVSDAVAASRLAMNRAPSGAVYNVGGGSEASLDDIVALFEEISGRRLDMRFVGPQEGDVRRTAADTSRIRTETGWEPRVDLRPGLRAQLEWVTEVSRHS